MKKEEVIKLIAEEVNITQAEAKMAIDIMFDKISDALETDGRFCIKGFGTFNKRVSKERNAHNPRTREPIVIPEHNVVRFHASPNLVNKVN
jgi:nucleoid DNA-binding protein